MGSTIPLDELTKYADNVYEAIIMIAKRADQISNVQKKMMDAEFEAYAEEEELDEDGVNQDYVERQYLKMPKPITMALDEMLDGKLEKVIKEKEKDKDKEKGKEKEDQK